jgi:hypothetical protein
VGAEAGLKAPLALQSLPGSEKHARNHRRLPVLRSPPPPGLASATRALPCGAARQSARLDLSRPRRSVGTGGEVTVRMVLYSDVCALQPKLSLSLAHHLYLPRDGCGRSALSLARSFSRALSSSRMLSRELSFSCMLLVRFLSPSSLVTSLSCLFARFAACWKRFPGRNSNSYWTCALTPVHARLSGFPSRLRLVIGVACAMRLARCGPI